MIQKAAFILFIILVFEFSISARDIGDKISKLQIQTPNLYKVSTFDLQPQSNHIKHYHSQSDGGSTLGHHHDKKSGENSEKDFKTHYHHEEKDYGDHDRGNQKQHYDGHKGEKKHNRDVEHHYEKDHGDEKGHMRGKFSEKEGHKKGHKSMGYNNKFHKDEFYKELKIYDDPHKGGYHSKHGDSQIHREKKKKDFKKGDKHHIENEGQHNRKGDHQKGHRAEKLKGHHGNHDHEKHHQPGQYVKKRRHQHGTIRRHHNDKKG